jgi:hypothetical protein
MRIIRLQHNSVPAMTLTSLGASSSRAENCKTDQKKLKQRR